ncbi:MAG: hypothetical protein AAFV25_23850, partial [Bacteroidota bacterium]
VYFNFDVDENDHCQLEIVNSVKKKTLNPSRYQGLGMVNIRKRLNLQYPDKHQLKEQKTEDTYRLHLSMPLSRKK